MPEDEADDAEGSAECTYRITSASSARSIATSIWDGDEDRQKKRAQVRSQLEGAPPFSAQALIDRGEEWRTNYNFRDTEAMANRAATPFWEMVHSTPQAISVTVFSDSPHSEKWNTALAQCFDRFLDDWGASYMAQFGQMVEEYVRFGVGIPRWEDNESPRWVSMEGSDLIWPKNTPSDIDRWEVMLVRHEMTPSELLKKHKEAAKDSDSFWDADMTKQAIIRAKRATDTSSEPTDWNKLQDEITQNDLTATVVWPAAELYTLYVREEDGRIGEYTFLRTLENVQRKTEAEMKASDGFLFRRVGYYKNFRETVGPVYWGTGRKKIHSVKGFAVRNFGLGVLTDKTKCRIIDGGMLALGINMVRGADANAEDAPPMQQFGPVNVFPQGMQFQAVQQNLREGMNTLNVLENTSAENNTQYRETQNQIRDTDTATQAEILANMEAQVTQANAALFLAQLSDNVYGPMFFRLLNGPKSDPDVKKFHKRAGALKVPEDVLKGDMFEIKVEMTASPSMASSAARTQVWRELLQFANRPGVDGDWILRSYVANRVNSEAVDKVLPPDAVEGSNSAQRLALFENAHLAEGMPIPVDPMDNHVVHIEVHMPAYESAVQRGLEAEKGGDEEAFKSIAPFLKFMTPHLALHFQQAERDETLSEMVDPLRERYQATVNAMRGLITRLGDNTNGQGR